MSFRGAGRSLQRFGGLIVNYRGRCAQDHLGMVSGPLCKLVRPLGLLTQVRGRYQLVNGWDHFLGDSLGVFPVGLVGISGRESRCQAMSVPTGPPIPQTPPECPRTRPETAAGLTPTTAGRPRPAGCRSVTTVHHRVRAGLRTVPLRPRHRLPWGPRVPTGFRRSPMRCSVCTGCCPIGSSPCVAVAARRGTARS